MKHAVSLFLVLVAVWFGWSGHTEALLLTLGVLSCLAVVAFGWRIGVVDAEGVPLSLGLRLWLYAPWLVWQIFLANLHVAGRILSPRLRIRPRLLRVRASQRTDLGRTIYANSITLTPGTLSVRVEGNEILVHALTRETADDLLGGEMDRRVTRVEGAR